MNIKRPENTANEWSGKGLWKSIALVGLMITLAVALTVVGIDPSDAIAFALIVSLAVYFWLALRSDRLLRTKARVPRYLLKPPTSDPEWIAMSTNDKIKALRETLDEGVKEGMYTQRELEEWTSGASATDWNRPT